MVHQKPLTISLVFSVIAWSNVTENLSARDFEVDLEESFRRSSR